MKTLVLAAVGALPALAAPSQDSAVLAPGAKVEKLADGFKFTEGPTADAQGNVYFTDQPNDRIHRWDVEAKKLTTWMEPCGRSNGLHFDAKGNLIACADDRNELWSIDPSGKHTVLLKDWQGKLLNGPNDLWIRPDGGIYFTDPFYKRAYWKRGPMEQDVQAVYFLGTDRKLRRVADDLRQPNGITGTPDGKTLYVADIGAKKTYSYEIQADGSLAGKKLFCEEGSDGVTIDDQGNLYLTGRGVMVFDRTGRKIETLPVPEPWVGNVCFGGKDRRTLFITASKGFYSVAMKVKGANPFK